ncbi:pilin [Paraferrimonas sedimenticola]|uniref:Prepilin-type N-terminal cleavage/methylation domain-containing protein n=1 Tax=Paraferrimonas sedimenticola TaxID=375674 RepID=A0AA37RYJ9_9GAMM|nr:pilin [Paraferrimonas sedimenticola]GLP97463.1 prepilin-type N-terminal cleavage/methylation domain-containing protein [Paraferrimonas sedimenticola]
MKQSKGFTLIELLIVVAIIGILAAVAIPQYQNYIAKAEAGTAYSTLASLKSPMEAYVLEKGSLPGVDGELAWIGASAGLIVNGSLEYTASGIQVTMGANGSPAISGAVIALSRTAGATASDPATWACTYTYPTAGNANHAPKGCTAAAGT